MNLRLAVTGIALLSATGTLEAQRSMPFETPMIGGSSGAMFADRCHSSEVMAGISARVAGGEITSVGIVCRSVGTDGTLGMSQPAHALHGDSPAATAVAECPRGQVLRGLAVYFADAVRGLGLYCRVWEGSAFGAAGAASETVGATSGTMAPVTCPPDGAQPAVGIGGAIATRIVSLRLVCDTPRR